MSPSANDANALPLLPITVIGSFPKPKSLKLTDWFSTGSDSQCKTDKAREDYERELKQADPAELESQLLEATREIIDEHLKLGVNIPTDGEVRRDNYVYTFCRSLDGISFEEEDLSEQNIRGVYTCKCPTVVGKVSSRAEPTVVEEWRKVQALSSVPVKITIPGPMTICDTIAVDHAIKTGVYKDRKEICNDLVPIIRREVLALAAAGCKHVQLDEPVFARRVEEALAYGIKDMDRIFEDVPRSMTRQVHLCCGYPNHLDQVSYPHAPKEAYIRLAPALDACNIDWISLEDAHCKNDLKTLLPLFKAKTIMFGSIKIHISKVESVEEIQQRIEEALQYIDAHRLVLAPDCGLGFLPMPVLRQKMINLHIAAQRIRAKLVETEAQEPPRKQARMAPAPEQVIEKVEKIYREQGHIRYVQEVDASSLDHARQCGHLAEQQGAPKELVAAAFLHDIGHLILKEDDETRLKKDQGHESCGANWLSQHGFPRSVVEPVRLHVPAKRYLCGVDRGYYDKLLMDSKLSLKLQGGPMTGSQVCEFQTKPYALGGVQVRLWDDKGKRPATEVNPPPLEHFLEVCLEVLREFRGETIRAAF